MTMCFCYHPRYEVKHIKCFDFVHHWYLCQFIECILSNATLQLCNKRHIEHRKQRLKSVYGTIKTSALTFLCDARKLWFNAFTNY